DRLCGADPDLYRESESIEQHKELQDRIEQVVVQQRIISVRKLARALGVSKNRIARLLKNEVFKEYLHLLKDNCLSITKVERPLENTKIKGPPSIDYKR